MCCMFFKYCLNDDRLGCKSRLQVDSRACQSHHLNLFSKYGVEHGGGELKYEGFGLQVQIPHHCITIPAAHHSNGAMVDETTEGREQALISCGYGDGAHTEGFGDVLGFDSDTFGVVKI
jgi:hypothetical protein